MTGHDALEARLRGIVSHLDGVPPLVDEGARAAFGWRTIDADLAELMRDSADELAESRISSAKSASIVRQPNAARAPSSTRGGTGSR